ncbi:uncharacterized protein LOC121771938 isoform X2 [Salvia splendens]|uniref:uncharacterized protein LOC121771938 isoform X2 n=1 Tax=Salvia splendens TaxID=180675 RepID=UPI001C25247E|nr:uncharacterized protein LOC121771938 isoform X2 [Salvia splendens]
MQVFVSLYWGGRIYQLPHVGICYDPPRARASIVLDSCVSLSELVGMICAKIRIDSNQHFIEISWRHCFLGTGTSYVCTAVDSDQSVFYMFNAALNSTRHIELFVEYSYVGNALIPPIVDHGVGSSTRFEPMSIDCGMNEQTDVADVGLNTQENVQEHADVDVVRGDLADPELSSSSSDDILSDDSGADSSDEDVVYKPVVKGEQPLPEYVHTGLKYFRKLPSGRTEVPEVGNERSTMYWDEEHPYRINGGTKFDSKLHVKTAITMWSLRQHRQFRVVESKLRRWHAVCKYPNGRTEDGTAIISETDADKANECRWEVSVTHMAHDEMWEIRKWRGRHSCEGHRNDRGHANFSSPMIALCIRHQLLKNAEFSAAAVRNFVHDKFHVVVSYKKAWYARRRALEIVFGGWEESFRDLPSYMLELQYRNPGTIVEWRHNELLSQGRTKVFYYVFWALGPAIHAFQECQPVLTIDGTHLRGRFKGSCILQYWNFSAALQPCKCPMCSQRITKLIPEASLYQRRQSEISKVIRSVGEYNRLFMGGISGFVLKFLAFPLYIKRTFRDMLNPDRPGVYLHEMRIVAVVGT